MTKLKLDKETGRSGAWLLFDLFMVGVASINLLWILFDWLYASVFIQGLFRDYLPWFESIYAPIHNDFIRYDLYFVIFFLTEFTIRWIIAIFNKQYYRWFFYPFVHWYDILGCIPIGGLRWLRFLRIIVVVTRLQRMGLIKIQNWAVSGWLMKYYEIFVEELSDRIVVNVIKEVKAEIKDGHQTTSNIREKVIDPYKTQLIEIIAERIQRVVEKNYTHYKPVIETYVRDIVKNSTDSNSDLKMIQKLPLFGNITKTTLEKAISDIVLNIVSRAMNDFISANNYKPIENIVDDVMDGITESGREELERIVSEIALESLDMVKERVEVQRWKFKYLSEEELKADPKT